MTHPKRPSRPNASADVGIGGLIKGLGDLVERLSELAEKGESEINEQREFELKGLGEKARGVYGFSVRTGIGGIPRVQRFGNIRATESGPEVAEAREPLVDMFDEADELVVVAELPGVDEADILVEVRDDVLVLETTGDRKFAKELLLSCVVDPAQVQRTYRNGILEIRLKKV
jgi:HSP20 family protein